MLRHPEGVLQRLTDLDIHGSKIGDNISCRGEVTRYITFHQQITTGDLDISVRMSTKSITIMT